MLLDLKKRLYRELATLTDASPGADLDSAIASLSTPETNWRVAHPMNEGKGTDFATDVVFEPLKRAFPDLERRDVIFVAGTHENRTYIAALGHLCGTFEKDWLTVPANGQTIYLRYGEVYEIADEKIVQANLLWDVLDVIRQAGFWPLAPSLGVEGMWPGPRPDDGIVLYETNPQVSAQSIEQTLAMHKTLFDFDQKTPTFDGLMNMEQKHYWHPKTMWYGPCGIGTARGLKGFILDHQLAFREAFQRPKGTPAEVEAQKAKYGASHYIRIGDGPYSVTGGWPSIVAQHYGGDFCGIPATGKMVTMRVMDFYHHDEGLIRENWVPIDMLDIFRQMGLDVLGRLQHHFDRQRWGR